MAIITRCRMPPENSWGKSRTRARGMPTSSRSSSARRIATGSSTFSWRTIGSAICRPIRRTGFKEFIAPWKMIEMSFHRTLRTAVSEARVRSRPLKRIRPRTIFPLYGKRRIRARAVVVLPQPLSPARPSASPSSRSNETPSTAWTVPSCVVYSTTRSSTSRSGILAPPETRVQDFIKRVSEEINPDDEDEPREVDHPQLRGDDDHEHEPGDRQHDVVEAHHDLVEPASRETGDEADRGPDDAGHDRGRDSHDEGDPRSPDDLGVDVETEVVRPDRMQRIGPLQERRRIGVRDGLPGTVRREPRCGEREEGEEDEDAHPDHRGAAVVDLGPAVWEHPVGDEQRRAQDRNRRPLDDDFRGAHVDLLGDLDSRVEVE